MEDQVVLDVAEAHAHLNSDTVALSATSKLTVSTDTATITGSSASIDASTTSITMKSAGFMAAANTSITMEAATELDLDAAAVSMSTDAMSVSGPNVQLTAEKSLTVAASTFAVRNADDVVRVSVAALSYGLFIASYPDAACWHAGLHGRVQHCHHHSQIHPCRHQR